MSDEQKYEGLDCWAIVDLFGHNRVAGKLTTQTLGAACLLRMDVPEVVIPSHEEYTGYYRGLEREKKVVPERRKGGYTRFFGVGAIYSINPVTEELARRAVAAIDSEPVKPYEMPEVKALPASQVTTHDDESTADEGDGQSGGTAEPFPDAVCECGHRLEEHIEDPQSPEMECSIQECCCTDFVVSPAPAQKEAK